MLLLRVLCKPRPTWRRALRSAIASVAGAVVLIDAALQQALRQVLPPRQALREGFARDYDALCPAQRVNAQEEVLSARPVLLKDGLQLSAGPAQAAGPCPLDLRRGHSGPTTVQAAYCATSACERPSALCLSAVHCLPVLR